MQWWRERDSDSGIPNLSTVDTGETLHKTQARQQDLRKISEGVSSLLSEENPKTHSRYIITLVNDINSIYQK